MRSLRSFRDLRDLRTPTRPVGSAFDPSRDPLALLWWDPTTLSDGAVSSWTDRIASVAATQATGTAQPTRSATAIGSAYPGVTGDAGDVLTAAIGSVVGGKAGLTFTAAMVDSVTAVAVAIELTTNATTTDGGFFVVVNDGGAGRINAATRGTSGYTARFAAEALSSVKVVSIGFDYATAGAGAVPFIRVNGAVQSLTNQITGSAAGSAANASLRLFARSGPSVGWAGTLGDVVIREGVAQDAGLSAIESYIASRCGVTL